MQTSGSTGRSKIIQIPYERIKKNTHSLRYIIIIHFVTHFMQIFFYSKIFGINKSDCIFWGTPLTFDPTLIELLLAMLNGACLVIVPYPVYVNPYSLYKSLFHVKAVSFLQMVPSVFLRWDNYYQRIILNSKNIRILSFGGESFPKKILAIPKHDDLKLFNLYGITEVSCWATVKEINTDNIVDEIPLGETLEDTVIEVRDENGKAVNNGKGEIFIGEYYKLFSLVIISYK